MLWNFSKNVLTRILLKVENNCWRPGSYYHQVTELLLEFINKPTNNGCETQVSAVGFAIILTIVYFLKCGARICYFRFHYMTDANIFLFFAQIIFYICLILKVS